MKAWDRDITDLGQELDWEAIWDKSLVPQKIKIIDTVYTFENLP